MEVELIYHRRNISMSLAGVDTNSGNIRQLLQFIIENEDKEYYLWVKKGTQRNPDPNR